MAFADSTRLVCSSTNQVVMGSSQRFTIHAEENLIKKLIKIKAKERFGNISVLVMRWSKTKHWTMARPCQECFNALKKYGIKDIFYTNENGKVLKDDRRRI